MRDAPMGGERIARESTDLWEVTDADVPPMRLTREQVLALVAQGRLGFASKARRAGEPQWSKTVARAEFGFGFPHMNFLNRKGIRKYGWAEGTAVINPNFNRATTFARNVAMNPESLDHPFWFSVHVDWAPAPIIRKTKLFKMWDGFWVAPVLESGAVMPGGPVNVYLVAFNLSNKEQARTLRASGVAIPEEAKGSLDFVLPPWKWTVQRLSFPATGAPGEHMLSLKTKSGAERAATAIAVGVLTLGTFLHVPGSSGFSLHYRILPPDTAKSVAEWQAFGVQAAARRIDEAHASELTDPAGFRTPKEAILRSFSAYLTPALVLAALEDKGHRPEDTMASFFEDFLHDGFGVDRAAKAFVPQ